VKQGVVKNIYLENLCSFYI